MNMMLKPLLKKLIEYIATKDNKLTESEVNDWIKEAGLDIQIQFKDGQLILTRSK